MYMYRVFIFRQYSSYIYINNCNSTAKCLYLCKTCFALHKWQHSFGVNDVFEYSTAKFKLQGKNNEVVLKETRKLY